MTVQARRARRPVRRVLLALVLLGASCLGYAFFIEPSWIEVTHHPGERVCVEDGLVGKA